MEMNDILNGLNSCDDDCCDTTMSNNCGCGPSCGGPGFGGFPGGIGGFGNACGCGFGSWIWILLILFYCGCGRGRRNGNECCCHEEKEECCGRGNYGSGLLSNCSPYLFILVILFLCNNNFNGCGVGNCGFGGGINPCNLGCGTSC